MRKVLKFKNTSVMQLEIAEKHMKNDDFPSAVQAMRRAAELGDFKNALMALGETYLSGGLVVQAFETFAEAYCKGAATPQCLFGLCRTAFLLGFDEDSSDYFKQMFLKNIELSDDLDAKINEFEDSFVDFPELPEDRGFTFVNSSKDEAFDEDMLELVRENPEGALPYFENIPQTSSLYYEARNNVALIKLMCGATADALFETERVLKNRPNDVFALSTRLACYAGLGFRDKAEETAKIIDGLNITDGERIGKIALSMCQANMHERAVRYLEMLTDRKYERNIMFLLAIAYYNIGNVKSACSALRDLQKLYPKESLTALDLIERMLRPVRTQMEYSVVMPHSDALRHINECRDWFEADSDEFNPKKLSRILKSDENYRKLYWYLTTQAFNYKHDELTLLFRLCAANDKRCTELVLELLRDFEAEPSLKGKCVHVLLCGKYEGTAHIVICGKIKKIAPRYPLHFEEAIDSENMNEQLWTDAFAVAFYELLVRCDGFETKLRTAAMKVYENIKRGNFQLVHSIYALAAVMFTLTGCCSEIKTAALCRLFGISRKTYVKYMKDYGEEYNAE